MATVDADPFEYLADSVRDHGASVILAERLAEIPFALTFARVAGEHLSSLVREIDYLAGRVGTPNSV